MSKAERHRLSFYTYSRNRPTAPSFKISEANIFHFDLNKIEDRAFDEIVELRDSIDVIYKIPSTSFTRIGFFDGDIYMMISSFDAWRSKMPLSEYDIEFNQKKWKNYSILHTDSNINNLSHNLKLLLQECHDDQCVAQAGNFICNYRSPFHEIELKRALTKTFASKFSFFYKLGSPSNSRVKVFIAFAKTS